MNHVHTYPVDASLTPDLAWEEICFWGFRVTYTAGDEKWAIMVCDGEECWEIRELNR